MLKNRISKEMTIKYSNIVIYLAIKREISNILIAKTLKDSFKKNNPNIEDKNVFKEKMDEYILYNYNSKRDYFSLLSFQGMLQTLSDIGVKFNFNVTNFTVVPTLLSEENTSPSALLKAVINIWGWADDDYFEKTVDLDIKTFFD